MFGDAVETTLRPKFGGGGEGVSAEGHGCEALWGAVVVHKCNHQHSLSTDQSELTLESSSPPPFQARH